MADWAPKATILKIDDPLPGWYQAVTSYGTACKGVRVKGTDHKFRVGQVVAVVQIGEEFGFAEFGSVSSKVLIPPALIGNLAKEAPASLALNQIGKKAENFRNHYRAAKIEQVINSNKVLVEGSVFASEVSNFSDGDGCLIELFPGKPPRVLGFWQTAPSDRVAVVVKRIKDTASALIQLVNMAGYAVEKSVQINKFPETEYVDANQISVLKTNSAIDYFYIHVHMFRNFGAANEDHYIKLDKINWTFEEITEGEYLLESSMQPAFTQTVDSKFWYHDNSFEGYSRYIYTSETEAGEQMPVYKVPVPTTAPYFIPEYWLPDKNYKYTEIVV